MSLKTALASLPDDRETAACTREVIGYLAEHYDQPVTAARIARVVGMDKHRVETVMRALAAGYVVDCGGDPEVASCVFKPDSLTSMEVNRFMRSAVSSSARLQRDVDRFRGRYGSRP